MEEIEPLSEVREEGGVRVAVETFGVASGASGPILAAGDVAPAVHTHKHSVKIDPSTISTITADCLCSVVTSCRGPTRPVAADPSHSVAHLQSPQRSYSCASTCSNACLMDTIRSTLGKIRGTLCDTIRSAIVDSLESVREPGPPRKVWQQWRCTRERVEFLPGSMPTSEIRPEQEDVTTPAAFRCHKCMGP